MECIVQAGQHHTRQKCVNEGKEESSTHGMRTASNDVQL